jgi:hypothetical protein
VAGFSEHGNESSDFIKDVSFLDQLSNYQILKYAAAWSVLNNSEVRCVCVCVCVCVCLCFMLLLTRAGKSEWSAGKVANAVEYVAHWTTLYETVSVHARGGRNCGRCWKCNCSRLVPLRRKFNFSNALKRKFLNLTFAERESSVFLISSANFIFNDSK